MVIEYASLLPIALECLEKRLPLSAYLDKTNNISSLLGDAFRTKTNCNPIIMVYSIFMLVAYIAATK